MTWLVAFFAMAATDLAWALYVNQVKEGDALRSAGWAVALFLLGAVAVISYTIDPLMLIPSAAGAFVGTWVGVKWSQRESRRSGIEFESP